MELMSLSVDFVKQSTSSSFISSLIHCADSAAFGCA